MKLIVIRHAIAQDRKQFAKGGEEEDGLRPLTPRGRRRMRLAARGLLRVAPRPDVLATSPLVRAVQTAEILGGVWADVKIVKVPQLTPEASTQALLKWLQERKQASTVALVGHEPQLSAFVSWMLTGLPESFVRLKKGGACLVELNEQVRPGRGRLVWSLAPAQLRLLGGH